MPVSRKVQGLRCLLPCLLLLSASALASGRDVRLHGPNGDGGSCPEATPAPATPADKATTAAPAASRSDKIKPVITVRSGGSDDGSSHAPRWHSFLPGMFR